MARERIRRLIPDMPDPLARMERAWRALMGQPFAAAPSEGLWHPTLDVYDRAEDVVVQAELPGMKGQKMSVSLEEEHLIIEGSRARPEHLPEDEAFYCERPYGDFHRVVHLPCSVDSDGISAQYDDGILTVTMPKAVRDRARRIDVT